MLERAARSIYKEWFVRLRFPDHEHAVVDHGVPAGWTTRKISEVCVTVGGGTPSTKVPEYWDGDVTWVVPSDVTGNDCLALLKSERKIVLGLDTVVERQPQRSQGLHESPGRTER